MGKVKRGNFIDWQEVDKPKPIKVTILGKKFVVNPDNVMYSVISFYGKNF